VISRPVEFNEVIVTDRFLLFPILSVLFFYTYSIVALIIFNIIFEEYIFFKILLSSVVVIQAILVLRFKKDNIYALASMGYNPLIRKSKFRITSDQITVEFHDSDSFFIEWSEFDSIEIKIAKRIKPLIVKLLKVYATELSVKFFEINKYNLLKMVKIVKLNSRRFRKNNLLEIAKFLIKCAAYHKKELNFTEIPKNLKKSQGSKNQ